MNTTRLSDVPLADLQRMLRDTELVSGSDSQAARALRRAVAAREKREADNREGAADA